MFSSKINQMDGETDTTSTVSTTFAQKDQSKTGASFLLEELNPPVRENILFQLKRACSKMEGLLKDLTGLTSKVLFE
jgi:hypothetical protein